ncbi:MAG: 6-phosphofructokinase [Bacteroidetes bacterium]|nr:6-phosphofructokinase [Bacteroidia bacterium]PCH67976.1 MAG: 6-phosphofructokinase [Bacteroidota bacterium]
MANKITKIGVFTSGGDAPGMNAAIRAVVRTGIYHGLEVMGIYHGYDGMIDGEIKSMDSASVSNILQRGGTILRCSRSEAFRTNAGRKKAALNLKMKGINGVVAIGGDGTFRGADVFYKECRIPIIGLPGTIDNDLFGTQFTVGYDTAINTALDAIDKLRDTAASHDRLFIIEVMGRDVGLIALRTGIAAGAEAVLVPETKTDIDRVIGILEKGWKRKKSSSIIVVSEGDKTGGAYEVASRIQKKFKQYKVRVSILGYLQRGGKPTCMDRVLASRLGVAAVEALISGKANMMVGASHNKIIYTPFNQATKHHNDINPNLYRIAEILSN